MEQATRSITVVTPGRGLIDITGQVVAFVTSQSITTGLLTIFCRYTSASLLIQENADPDVLKDLKDFFAQLAKKGMDYRHIAEGPDDMPSHIRAALTQTSIGIPVKSGTPALGTWQGLYVFEHREAPHHREVLLHFIGD